MPELRVTPLDPRSSPARALIDELDAYQSSLYPPESNHFDSIEELAKPHVHFLGAFEGDALLGCGAVKLLGGYGELKRMYVRPEFRGKGIGRQILAALEAIAAEAGFTLIRLETGVHQPEAIRLYSRSGYREIRPFGDYHDDPLSLFMEKCMPPAAIDVNKGDDHTRLSNQATFGLGALDLRHPAGTCRVTPASLIALEAIGRNRRLLSGLGIDWGSGSGVLAIAASRIDAVARVYGLELFEANVAIARANARQNQADSKARFLRADSFQPLAAEDRRLLEPLKGRVNFLIANPPASQGDDGFGFRTRVLREAADWLADGARIFLNVSYQYGRERLDRLCEQFPLMTYRGLLATTDWVPFDLTRPDLLQCLEQYAHQEHQGAPPYEFQHPRAETDQPMTARAALAHFHRTAESPLSKWQVHLFEFHRR